MYFVGLDIGTSGTKAVCMDETGNLKKIWYVSYGFEGMARGAGPGGSLESSSQLSANSKQGV